MKKIIEFPDRKLDDANSEIIEQQAVEWLIKLDRDTPPTAQELQQLKEWMARSPAHTKEMESLGDFWGDLSLTELNVPLVKVNPDTFYTKTRATKTRWAIAAGVLGLALLLQQTLFPGGQAFDVSNGVYATAIGKQSTIPLADGSVVRLNTNSQIKVEYSEGFRNIRLVQGEAHFDVAKNKNQPFRVYAGEGRVQAVGTAFTVYLREEDVDVLVTEGKVELAVQKIPAATEKPVLVAQPIDAAAEAPSYAHGNEPEYYLALPVEQLGLLTEGQGATIVIEQVNKPQQEKSTREVKLMDADTLKRKDAWRRGLLLFTGDTLEEVVAEIGRYTSATIEIIDPELKKIRIGGQFRVGDLSGMFDALETNFGLSIKQLDNNRVQISAAGEKDRKK